MVGESVRRSFAACAMMAEALIRDAWTDRVDHVEAVRGAHEQHSLRRFHAVHLVEQRRQHPLLHASTLPAVASRTHTSCQPQPTSRHGRPDATHPMSGVQTRHCKTEFPGIDSGCEPPSHIATHSKAICPS
eukprot:2623295-Rhodomonas_salina.2